MRIDILLTVHNGLPFLEEQIRSLQAQTHEDWRLWVRDDLSSDGTARVLKELAGEDGRIVLMESGSERKGALGGFAWLMDEVRTAAEYTMFCDHDDVWLPNKIQTTLALMLEIDSDPVNRPALVHTDLTVTDAELVPLAASFWQYQGIRPENGNLADVLRKNPATGCTVMINRCLFDMARPVPNAAVMHDWWLSLVATAFGEVRAVSEQTMLYRQHGRNDSGARKKLTPAQRLTRHFKRDAGSIRQESIERRAAQAREFLAQFGPLMDANSVETLRRFESLPGLGLFRRKLRLLAMRHGI